MGKMQRIYYEKLIGVAPDRNANLLRVYQAPNGEVTIHLRNLKIVLHTPEEIAEWKRGFTEAAEKLKKGNHFKGVV